MVDEAHSLEAGLDVKYLIMLLCIEGIRHKHRTTAFTAIIPGKHWQGNLLWRNMLTLELKSKTQEQNECVCSILLPVTVFCPSVRLLQTSSTIDMSRMSCRWTPESWFHQSCQCAVSWEPWWCAKGKLKHRRPLRWWRAVGTTASPVRAFLSPFRLLQFGLLTSASHIAEWQPHQRSNL